MKVMARILALIALLALVVSAPVFAQDPPPKQPGTPAQPPAKQPGTPPALGTAPAGQPPAPPVNAEEEAAYKAFFDSKEDSLKTKLGEEFQEKFPASRYRESVYAALTTAYQNMGQEEKMFATCDKTLEINADNLAALVTIAKALPRRTDAKALDAQQKFDKAEKYGKRALELLAAMSKPGNVTEEVFAKAKNDALADVHSGLGLVYLQKGRLAESIAALEQATKVTASPDQSDFYLLGVALQGAKRFEEAMAAYGSCASVASPVQEYCKQGQAEAKKQAAAAAKAPAPAPPKP